MLTAGTGDPTTVPKKPELTKAERRAKQEAERAAKAIAKDSKPPVKTDPASSSKGKAVEKLTPIVGILPHATKTSF